MRVVGVDFGLRRIGLALSDPGEVVATPLQSLVVSSVRNAPAAVAKAAREAEAEAVVVGVPLGLEGEEARAEVRRVERFATALRRELKLPVHLVDESFSSREAEEVGSGGSGGSGAEGRAKRRASGADSHAVAAAVILQRWLDRPRRPGKGGTT